MASNIGAYFEIPVTDLDRAINFYQLLLGIELERGSIHGYDMAFFPLKIMMPALAAHFAKVMFTSRLSMAPLSICSLTTLTKY